MTIYASDEEEITGSETGDYVIATGYGLAQTLYGGAGDDLLVAGSVPVFVDVTSRNNMISRATNIDDAAYWTASASALVGDARGAHATIVGTGTDNLDYFVVTLGAGARLTLDIDFAHENGVFSTGGFSWDTMVQILSPGGGAVATNDDAGIDTGGAGSWHAFDSYLEYIAREAGTYYIVVGRYSGVQPVPLGYSYLLNVSVTGHEATAVVDTTGDTLIGEGDDDFLLGGAGGDILDGGQGSDRIYAGAGEDRISGGEGDDIVFAEEGHDTVQGGDGNDGLYGEAGNDQLFGEGGDDTILGGLGRDTIDGGLGRDRLEGDENNDVIYGRGGRDGLTGGTGDDLLFGGAGGDALNGGDGDDRLDGGAGNDVLTGGAGADEFVFARALGTTNVDTIADFAVADDTILLGRRAFAGLTEGALPEGAFALGAVAAEADDRILFDQATGALYFDADGAGGVDAVQFALVSPQLPLTADHFLVI